MNRTVFTIPNLISAFRILLIPLSVFFFFRASLPYHEAFAVGTLLLSGFSDVLDGKIARKFHMVSDLGKLLDPIADKLTQAAVVFSLLFLHPLIFPMFIVFFVKELLTAFAAAYLLRHGTRPISAKWWGKLSTVVIYVTTVYLIVSDFFSFEVLWLSYFLIYASIVVMLISMFGYLSIFLKPITKDK